MLALILTLFVSAVANSAPIQPVSHDFMGQLVAGLIVLGGLGTVLGFQVGKKRVTVDPQPFGVEIRDAFVTRREFDELKIQVAAHMQKAEGLFAQTMQAVKESTASTDRRIENQNKRLNESIEKVAKAAYEGRGKIWNTVNQQREDMARLTERCDVAEGIQKLGDVIATAITTKTHEQTGN